MAKANVVSRYSSAPLLGFGQRYGTARAIELIRTAVNSGAMPCKERVLRESERLDTIAGDEYGDARYWWILAASSGIGWALQCPPGTLVLVPELKQALAVIGSER